MNKQDTINEIRAFNRFYTVLLGFLNRNYLDSGYSVTETRILFELSQSHQITANHIIEMLRLDKGYVSRLIRSFEEKGIVTRAADPNDRRSLVIQLTDKGQAEADRLIEITNCEIGKLIEPLSAGACEELCRSTRAIKEILSNYTGF